MSVEDMLQYFDSLERESKALKNEVLKICWYMRGGITYDDAMLLSRNDRQTVFDLIKDNLETTKKSGLPFF